MVRKCSINVRKCSGCDEEMVKKCQKMVWNDQDIVGNMESCQLHSRKKGNLRCIHNWKQIVSISAWCNIPTNLALLPPSHIIVGVDISLTLRQPRVESAVPAAGCCLVHLGNVRSSFLICRENGNMISLSVLLTRGLPPPSEIMMPWPKNYICTLIELQNKIELAWSKTIAITYFVFCPTLCFNVNP